MRMRRKGASFGVIRGVPLAQEDRRRTNMLMAVTASTLLIPAIASVPAADTVHWPGVGSDPDIACGRPPAARMTGVQGAARLDEHELHFALGGGLVLDAFRDDEHLSRRDVDMPVPEVDTQRPLDNQECFVRFRMIVPDEVALKPDELELVVVHLGDDARAPLLVELVELLADVDGCVSHSGSPSQVKTSPGPRP